MLEIAPLRWTRDSVDKRDGADLVHRADGTGGSRAHPVDHVASPTIIRRR